MKNFFLVFIFSFPLFCNAQIEFGKFRYTGKLNFALIKAKADSFFAENEMLRQKPDDFENEEDNDYLRYKRWEWYWKDRVNEDGSFPDLLQQSAIYNQFGNNTQSKSATSTAPWANISQTSTTGGYNGMGRLTSIAFHPTDPNIFWVGAPIGGIWKTSDGGLTYSPLGEALPYCSVGNILVNPLNPDIIYITLGDHGGWWNYGLGVYKSNDGGLNWFPTTLISDFSDGIAYYAMVMSPANPNVILVARSNGLYRTVNGGVTWSLVHAGAHKDVKFRPNDSTTVYASTDDYWGSSEVYKSTNGGANFSPVSSFNAAQNTIKLTVTPANPNMLGILVSGATQSFYKSSSNGANITYASNVPEDAFIFFSPIDTFIVYTGYTKIYKSVTNGTSWTQLTNWFNNGIHSVVHADERFVASNPLNNLIYFCNDGGVYNYDEQADSWAELNSGLIITQFYSIAVSQNNPVFMIGGTQDNGGRKRTGINTWAATNGGDAMETAIDQNNNQTIYTTYVNGQLYRSFDQWTNDTYHDITPAGATGNWVTPYLLDPANQFTLLAGYEDVYKSTDRGDTWNKISNNLTGSVNNYLDELEVAPGNSNVIYAARENKVYKTVNGGTSWTTHTLPFSTSNFSGVTSIAVSPQASGHIYITVGGYSAGKKVYMSTSGGATWTNVSGTLPNIPVTASVFDENSPNHELYIGTDIGVFYISDTNSTWTYWGTNLPNTSVTDLKIQYATHKLRAATYGRGIWESDLVSIVTGAAKPMTQVSENTFGIAFNPVGDLLLLNADIAKGVSCELNIYDFSGKIVFTSVKQFQEGNYQVPLDISYLPPGMFFMKITSAFGSTSLKIVHTESGNK